MVLPSHVSLLGVNYRMKKLILCFIALLLLVSALPAAYAEHSVVCRANYNTEDASKKVIDFADFFQFSELWDNKDPKADLNKDGKIDFDDHFEFSSVFGQTCNHEPSLVGIGSKTVNENQALEITLGAQDEDGDSLTYTAAGMPQGASFSGSRFSWTPSYSQSNDYIV